MENSKDERPICKFFLQGYCKYQNKCFNLHSSKKKICFDFKQYGSCKYGSRCYFSHVIGDSNQRDYDEKSKPFYKNSKEKPKTIEETQSMSGISKTENPSLYESKEKIVQTPKKEEETKTARVENKEKKIQTSKKEEETKARVENNQKILQIPKQEEETKTVVLKNEEKEKEIQKNEKKIKHKPFIDFSKTQIGQEILEKNKDLWGFGISYFDYLKTLKLEKDIELCQIQRKYKSSFMWISGNSDQSIKVFQIRHSPTIPRDQIDLDFEIEEGYLWYEFHIQWNAYPESSSLQVYLINNSIPNPFKKSFSILFMKAFEENRSLFKTLRQIDNAFDKICQEANKKKEKGEKKDKWTQEQQVALEKAISKFRAIPDKEERWKAIANEVPEKDTETCMERFKECRERALKTKTEKEEEEEESESEEESSEEEIDESEESENEEHDKFDEESEEERELYEPPKEKTLENEYNVFLNLIVKVNELKMKQIGVVSLEEATVLVKCQKCKEEIDKKLRIHPEFRDYLYNDVLCANCNTSGVIILKKAFLHQSSNACGQMGSNTWDILDILSVNMTVVCETCNLGQLIEKYVVGGTTNYNCHSCFKETSLFFSSYSLTFEEYKADVNKNLRKTAQNQKNDEPKKLKVKKIGNFKLDQPLPNNGNCKHYKHSYRYFRFPCCGKCDPCDDCHLEKEKHEMILAKNMICGFCSYEQPIKDQCMRCGKVLTKKTNLGGKHWEGGKGCRNQKCMSKKDSHKFAGLGKTVSKHKQK